MRGAGRCVALLAVIAWSMAAYGVNRAHRRDAMARARWLQVACRRALRVLGISVETRGERAEGVLVAANHLSYLDILVLASLMPVVFVSKKEVRNWPMFGWFAKKAGTLFIDRSRPGDVAKIGAELGAVMTTGLNLAIFLEGTSSDGREVLPFKPALLEPAVRNGWRVMPVALSYLVPPGHSSATEVCWWGEMTLLPHLWNLTTLSWTRARVVWGVPVVPITGQGRKELAADLRSQVVSLSGAGLEA